MKKNVIVWLIVFVMAAVGVTALTERTLQAQGDSSNAAIIKKLDDIVNNQKTILNELASVKEELGIIKIRITQRI